MRKQGKPGPLPDPVPEFVRDWFPTDYIAAEDLKGRDVTLTISQVRWELLQRPGSKAKPEKKICVWFREMEERAQGSDRPNKRLVLNRTNADLIKQQLGPKVADWIGKQITIGPDECEAFGKVVPCVRVKRSESEVR